MRLRLFPRRRQDPTHLHDPSDMAETLEDERAAEEGAAMGLGPDLAVWVSRDDLAS